MAKPLPNIEHIVVLMLENRSFDNVLGGLYPEKTAIGEYHGLTGKEWNYNPVSPGLGTWTVWQASPTSAAGNIPFPDPGEEFTHMNRQLFGNPSPGQCPSPTMGGFAYDYALHPSSRSGIDWPSQQPIPRNIMQYFEEESVPTSYALAKKYAVCDVWYAAAPVQTISNRTFTHTGTPSKMPGTNKSRINNTDYTAGLSFKKIIEKGFTPPVTDTTIFEMLDVKNPDGNASDCSDLHDPDKDRQLNWKVYYHDAPLSALCAYVYDHWCNESFFGGNVFTFKEHLKSQTNFEYDIKRGLLPTYSFIEPAYTSFEHTANSNHPGGSIPDVLDLNGQNFPPPINIENGEALLAEVYSILVKYPEVFERTLLILTYDEHGGLYDHMQPGDAVSPFQPKVDNFDYNRYGVRVPTMLINPNIKSGMIFRPSDGQVETGACGSFTTQLDHTSIIKTLCEQFDLGAPPTPRAASAATLSGLLNGSSDQDHVPLTDLVVNCESDEKPRELGKSQRIRTTIASRKQDDFDGDSLNNAVFATFIHAFLGRLRQRNYSISEITDIEQPSINALDELGIRDTAQLLASLDKKGGLAHIAQQTGNSTVQILDWQRQASLLQVKGLCGDDAYILIRAGINSPKELAAASSAELDLQLQSILAGLGVENVHFDQGTIDGWIKEAGNVP